MNTLAAELVPTSGLSDRRHWPRMKVSIRAELKPKDSDVPIRVTTADLSVGGCYVEMMFTLEVGRELDMVLWIDEYRLATKAAIVTCHPQFGNGIRFIGMAVEDQARLEGFLQAFAAESVQ